MTSLTRLLEWWRALDEKRRNNYGFIATALIIVLGFVSIEIIFESEENIAAVASKISRELKNKLVSHNSMDPKSIDYGYVIYYHGGDGYGSMTSEGKHYVIGNSAIKSADDIGTIIFVRSNLIDSKTYSINSWKQIEKGKFSTSKQTTLHAYELDAWVIDVDSMELTGFWHFPAPVLANSYSNRDFPGGTHVSQKIELIRWVKSIPEAK